MQHAVIYICSLVYTMNNYNNNQRYSHIKNLLCHDFLFNLFSWTQMASSKESHYGTCEGPIVGVDRIFVAWHVDPEWQVTMVPCLWKTLEIQRGTEPENGNLEEVPNLAIILLLKFHVPFPWCICYVREILDICAVFSLKSPSYLPPSHLFPNPKHVRSIEINPSTHNPSTCGVGIRQVGLQ